MERGYFDYHPPESPTVVECYQTIHIPIITESDLDKLIQDIYKEVKSHADVVEDSLGKIVRVDDDKMDYVTDTPDFQPCFSGELGVYFEVNGDNKRFAYDISDNLETLADTYADCKFSLETHVN